MAGASDSAVCAQEAEGSCPSPRCCGRTAWQQSKVLPAAGTVQYDEESRARLCDSGLPDPDVCDVLPVPPRDSQVVSEAWSRGRAPPPVSATNRTCSTVKRAFHRMLGGASVHACGTSGAAYLRVVRSNASITGHMRARASPSGKRAYAGAGAGSWACWCCRACPHSCSTRTRSSCGTTWSSRSS